MIDGELSTNFSIEHQTFAVCGEPIFSVKSPGKFKRDSLEENMEVVFEKNMEELFEKEVSFETFYSPVHTECFIQGVFIGSDA